MPELNSPPASSISNPSIRVEFLTTAGPRITGVFLAGREENFLAQADQLNFDTPYGEYRILGGHRLWHAPEAFPRSYLPDGDGLLLEQRDLQVTLTQPREPGTGFRKTIILTLDAKDPQLTMQHTIQNNSLWPVELAPWAITQLKLGGVAVLPTSSPSRGEFAPNRQLTLWDYTKWEDDRLLIKNDYLYVQGVSRDYPFKIGYWNSKGWMAYWCDGILFIKRFLHDSQKPYPDLNCNTECYCYNQFIELESLGPLTKLEPGDLITHTETWSFHSGIPNPMTSQGIAAIEQTLGLLD